MNEWKVSQTHQCNIFTEEDIAYRKSFFLKLKYIFVTYIKLVSLLTGGCKSRAKLIGRHFSWPVRVKGQEEHLQQQPGLK